MTMTAVIYARFSTTEQAKGDTLTRQIKNQCEPFCIARGWTIEDTLIDSGRSGFHGEHRGENAALGKFEREAMNGEHVGKVLVVERLDRLGREQVQRTYDLVSRLIGNGVSIATVDGARFFEANVDFNFIEMIGLLVSFKLNNEASEAKSTHSKSKWVARRLEISKRKVATSMCPAWLRVKEDRSGFAIVDEGKGGNFEGDSADPIIDRGLIVSTIYQWADEGWGSLRIVRKLNDMNVPTWGRFENRTPQTWQRSFVVRLLQDVAVTGDYQPRSYAEGTRQRVPIGEPVRNYYPRVVEPDLFQRVSSAAIDRKGVRGNRSAGVVNLVSGLAVCHECGDKMVYRQSRAAGYVRVRNGVAMAPTKNPLASLVCQRGETHGCSNRSYSAYTTLEKALVSDALHLAMDDKAFARRDEVAKIDVKLADVKRDQEIAYQTAIKRWEDADSSPIAKQMARDAEAKAAALQTQIDTLNGLRAKAAGQATAAEHLSRLQEIRDNLHSADMELRTKHRQKIAQGFRAVISKIVCHPTLFRVHFHGSVRVMNIGVEKGRRPPTISHLDLDHRGRDHSDDEPAVANLRVRHRADVAARKLKLITPDQAG